MDIVATAATRVGSALARPLIAKLGESLLGTPFERQLRDACSSAILRALSANGIKNDDDREHAVSVLQRLVQDISEDPIDLVLMSNGMTGWQEAADRLGIELETLVENPTHLLSTICAEIPREIARQAAAGGSAFFAPLIVQSLLGLSRQIDDLSAAHFWTEEEIRLDDALCDALVRNCTVVEGVRLIDTPSYLLALLTSSGVAVRLIDEARSGTSELLVARLEKFKAGPDFKNAKKVPLFRRVEVQQAQSISFSAAARSIDDRIAFAAFLRSSGGNTIRQLATLMDDKYLSLVLNVQAELIRQHFDRRTPDYLFVDKGKSDE